MVVAVRDSHYHMLCRLYKRSWCHVDKTKVKVRGQSYISALMLLLGRSKHLVIFLMIFKTNVCNSRSVHVLENKVIYKRRHMCSFILLFGSLLMMLSENLLLLYRNILLLSSHFFLSRNFLLVG